MKIVTLAPALQVVVANQMLQKLKLLILVQWRTRTFKSGATTLALRVKPEQKYSDAVAEGGFVEQSVAADSETTKGNVITVYRSIGPVPTTEQLNALNRAQNYSDNMHMSQKPGYIDN